MPRLVDGAQSSCAPRSRSSPSSWSTSSANVSRAGTGPDRQRAGDEPDRTLELGMSRRRAERRDDDVVLSRSPARERMPGRLNRPRPGSTRSASRAPPPTPRALRRPESRPRRARPARPAPRPAGPVAQLPRGPPASAPSQPAPSRRPPTAARAATPRSRRTGAARRASSRPDGVRDQVASAGTEAASATERGSVSARI